MLGTFILLRIIKYIGLKTLLNNHILKEFQKLHLQEKSQAEVLRY